VGLAGGLLVLVVMSYRVPSKIHAGFTRSIDTVTFLPRTTIWNVLSMQTAVWWIQGAAYGALP